MLLTGGSRLSARRRRGAVSSVRQRSEEGGAARVHMGCLAGPSGQKQGGEGAFLFFLFSEFSKSISNEFLN